MMKIKKIGNSSVVLRSKFKMIVFNLFGGISIFLVLIALRVPSLINADQLLSPDEALMAYQVLDLYNGSPLFFYYDVTKYFGIFNGLAAFPFFWTLGVGGLAFKLPAVFFYTLYILSTYLLVKKIQPQAALIVVLLMTFPSVSVFGGNIINSGLALISLLGNLIFLSFLKIKETGGSKPLYTFLLGFFVGFAIYTYTYSIVYIGSIVILFILSSYSWGTLRANVSIKTIKSWFIAQKGFLRKFVVLLDGIILFFIFVVLFSYTFGGFGIDIAGYSILQSNALHKPVGQLLVLVIFRFFLCRQDITDKLSSIKSLILSMDSLIRRSILISLLGFIIGILPRLLSIFSGETTRGGQGFDVDFVPTNLVYNFWQLIQILPDILGLRAPIAQLFDSEITSFHLVNSFLGIIIAFLISGAMISFLRPRWTEVKDIFKLKALSFNPAQFFLVLPILIFAALIVSQSDPSGRHLFPLHGVISICTAIYLVKVRCKSKTLFLFILTAWCTFSTIGTYQSHIANGAMRGFSIVEKPNPYFKLVQFCKEKEILNAYSDYSISSIGTFLSRGDIRIAEYTKNHWGSKLKEELAKVSNFSIIIAGNGGDLKVYQKYLDENLLSYSRSRVAGENDTGNFYYVFSNFQGEPKAIEQLRSLIIG